MDEIAHSRIEISLNRYLALSVFGDPNGDPVFFFHGWPGARLQGRIAHESARSLGIRLIAIDRPGFGDSYFQPARQILDWPLDIGQIADDLGLPTFAIVGLSGGAPYALACGYRIPERIDAIVIVSGLGPSDVQGASQGVSKANRTLVRLARYAPWSLPLILRWRRQKQLNNPEGAFHSLLASLSEVDRRALLGVKDEAIGAGTASIKPGVKGHVWELHLFANSWGFSRQDIPLPIQLWHGVEDEHIFLSTGQAQANALPNCTARFVPGEGHYSLCINRMGEIFPSLMEQTQ
jgi:pimeloyl-ACP methyl ester carboxylesterase